MLELKKSKDVIIGKSLEQKRTQGLAGKFERKLEVERNLRLSAYLSRQQSNCWLEEE